MENRISVKTETTLNLWLQQPGSSLQAIKAKTIQQAIDSDNPAMFLISQQSHDTAVAVITQMLAGVALFLNVGKNMTPMQIRETCHLVLEQPVLKNLKPDDFKLICDRIKCGEFGQQYDRFDGQFFIQCCLTYASQRQDEVENRNINNAANQKQESQQPVKDPQVAAKLRQLRDQLIQTERQKRIDSFGSPREKTEQQKLITQFFHEFDQIHQRSPVNKFGEHLRVIEFDGKYFQQIEFIEYKLKKHNDETH